MKFFHIFLNSCGDFDSETSYLFNPPSVSNIGLVIDWWPPDDLFQCHPEVFSNERLMNLISKNFQKFSGIERFDKVSRINVGANWKDNFGDAKPEQYWQVIISGIAMQDDIGYYYGVGKYLVISERLLVFLAHNHVTELLGQEIGTNIETFFSNFVNDLKRSNYNLLPPKLLFINIAQQDM